MIDILTDNPYLSEVASLQQQIHESQRIKTNPHTGLYLLESRNPKLKAELLLAQVNTLFYGLRREGLDVCFGGRAPHQGDELASLGIFPADALKLHYQRYTFGRWQDDFGQGKSFFSIDRLVLYCDQHYPIGSRSDGLTKVYDEIIGEAIFSEVEKVGDKLIASATQADVSRKPIERRFQPYMFKVLKLSFDPILNNQRFATVSSRKDTLFLVNDNPSLVIMSATL